MLGRIYEQASISLCCALATVSCRTCLTQGRFEAYSTSSCQQLQVSDRFFCILYQLITYRTKMKRHKGLTKSRIAEDINNILARSEDCKTLVRMYVH